MQKQNEFYPTQSWILEMSALNDCYILLIKYSCLFIHSFSIPTDDRFKASSKTIPPYRTI